MKILIKDIFLFDKRVDVLIKDNHFEKIGKIDCNKEHFDKVIDGKDKAILPAFYNLHCHAAMNILRGYCEDLPLFSWLQNIWKKEDKLKGEDIYNGTRLAILEMIKSGTVFFADMYWFHKDVIRAAKDMGIRADVGLTFMNKLDRKTIDEELDFLNNYDKSKENIVKVSPTPHAIYTCDDKLYKECYDVAQKNNLFLQTHLCETEQEVDDCKKQHQGLTPVEYLDKVGVLDNNTIAAHCVHLTDNDAKILSKRGVTLVHNPCSNMKLSSGAFNIEQARKYHCKVALGTDGSSSNNNLSMIEEMKMACLLAKVSYKKADAMTANEIFSIATRKGAEYYNINAGEIKEGMEADCIIVDMNNERMVPNYNIIYNMVYSADSSCIDSVICNGNILMENHHVDKEEEIIEIAKHYNEK
jgi:5-methylthioadenosine/S-adenosylhomocysteine deaminase